MITSTTAFCVFLFGIGVGVGISFIYKLIKDK